MQHIGVRVVHTPWALYLLFVLSGADANPANANPGNANAERCSERYQCCALLILERQCPYVCTIERAS